MSGRGKKGRVKETRYSGTGKPLEHTYPLGRGGGENQLVEPWTRDTLRLSKVPLSSEKYFKGKKELQRLLGEKRSTIIRGKRSFAQPKRGTKKQGFNQGSARYLSKCLNERLLPKRKRKTFLGGGTIAGLKE